ncbi:hypothetical protein [Nocardia inohanensis]|uniref:hypothetical protein n=1 Tax=Nocardia inohanensis TaxID=209246 RepID=UPI00082EEDE9|nr:hypothetical protein [Nocardia inohanensis]
MAVLAPAGVAAGPMAGGGVVLLAKPFGGEVGVPGEVIGYIAITALLCGCATAAWSARSNHTSRWIGGWAILARGGRSNRTSRWMGGWAIVARGGRSNRGARWISGCAVVAGAAWVVAGLSTHIGVFVAAVLIASSAAGPVLVAGRTLALAYGGRLLVGWHIAMWAGIAATAGLVVLCHTAPGVGLCAAGIAAILLGSIGMMHPAADTTTLVESTVPQSVPDPADRAEPATGSPWRLLIGYAGIGLGLGGTVLPALHLLLFRWSALDTEQAEVLLVAVLPAIVIAALPAPALPALPALSVLLAGGALLVATAPGHETVTVGLAVTLAAAARALRALDDVRTVGVAKAVGQVRESAQTSGAEASDPASRAEASVPASRAEPPGTARAGALPTALTVAGAGLAGLGLVVVTGRIAGTGTGMTLLALLVLAAAVWCAQLFRTPERERAVSVLEGKNP